jgi:outer membrane protein TolC
MSREGRRVVLHVSLTALVLLCVGTALVQAQPKGGGAPAKPPIMSFGPDGVTLEQAVTIALKNDPALRLAENDVERLAGALQEQQGIFDVTLLANVDFSYREQELSETRKADEIKKRKNYKDSLEDLNTQSSMLAQEAAVLSQLSTTQPGDPLVKQLLAFSPSLATQLQSLDAMILSPSTPADVKAELTRIRREQIQEALAHSISQKTQVDGLRQETQTKLTNVGEAPIDEFFRSGSFSLAFSKAFRSGASLSPFVDGSIETTTFVGKPISADFGGKGVQDQMTFRFGVNVMLPVLRGRGADAFASGEKAAKVHLEAGRFQAEHQASASALAVVRAYWALRAATESLDATARSLDLQTRVVDITSALIQAGEMPAVELARASAGAARAKAAVKDAERRVHEARVGLALSMGLSATTDDVTLPTAKDGFPALASVSVPAQAVAEGLSAEAVLHRRDLSAARKFEEASRILERGASLDTKPRLDVTGEAYYTALGERAFQRVVDRWVGPSVGVGVEFEKPFGNNRLEGALAQRAAERRQQQIGAADLERQIRLGVVRAATTLQEAAEHAREAASAVEFYQKTVDSELERFRVGESTLINTLITERQWTDARLSAVAAHQRLASLLAELRYETGTLLNGTTVSGANLITVPQAGGR